MKQLGYLIFGALTLLGQSTNPVAQSLFHEALNAQQQGDDTAALSKYTELLRLEPGAIGIRVNIGATLAHMGRFDEAISQYRIVLANQPDNRPAALNLASALEEKGNLAEAVKLLGPLVKSEPADPQAEMLLGDCFVRLKRYPEAVAVLQPLEAAHPDDLDLAWTLGSALVEANRTLDGLKRIEKVAAKANSVDAYLLAGQTRLARNEYDLAQLDAAAALRINPNLAGVQTLHGMVLQHRGDLVGSAAALRQALILDEGDFNAHLYLGAILYFDRDLKGARLHLERAIALQPGAPRPLYELALVSQSEGNFNAALRGLETVCRENPEWLEPHVELAALFYRLKRPEDGARERAMVDRLMAQNQQRETAAQQYAAQQ